VSILLSPISWIHYYSLLICPAALLLAERVFVYQKEFETKGLWKRKVLILAVALMSLPVVHTLPDSVIPEITIIEPLIRHILVSHYFFGGFLLLGFLLYSRRNLSEPLHSVHSD
jgi:hypothetical protein